MSDSYKGVCDICKEEKRVADFEIDKSTICDSCLVAETRARDKENYDRLLPKKHWSESFPEMVEKIKKKG